MGIFPLFPLQYGALLPYVINLQWIARQQKNQYCIEQVAFIVITKNLQATVFPQIERRCILTVQYLLETKEDCKHN